MVKKIIEKGRIYFTDKEKKQIIEELHLTGCTKQEIWHKYTGAYEEHGQILRWMRQLGYASGMKIRRPKLAPNTQGMTAKSKPVQVTSTTIDSFENLQLKKRILELEKQLKDAELKAIAFSTMVDIAEKEFKIPIRKKLYTKP